MTEVTSLGAGTGLGVRDDADSGEDGAEHGGRGEAGTGVEDRHGLQTAQGVQAGLATRGGVHRDGGHGEGLPLPLREVMRLLLQ